MSTSYKFDGQEKTNLPIFRTRKQGRVLLVEADGNIRQTVKFLLESQGYQVLIAPDIAKAYSLSRFRGFAFILFNWFMEGEAGGDLCKQIRLANKLIPLFFYNTQKHENAPDVSLEVNPQQYKAQSITTNAMLKAIFLQLEKDRSKFSSNR